MPNVFKGKCIERNVDLITVRFVGKFPSQLYPCKVRKDGNCFPRSMSKIIFDCENQHEQIRVKLVKEGVQNEDKYLNNEYLRTGVDSLKDVDLVEHFSEYSEQFNSSMPLDDKPIRQIFQRL